MEIFKDNAIYVCMGTFLTYIIIVWTMSSGHTWYYKPWRYFSKDKERREKREDLSKKTKETYRNNKRKFRRSFYALFIISMIIAFTFDFLQVSDWPTVVIFATAIIFTDISLFSTPVIRKAGKIEFEQEDEISEYVESYKKNELRILRKVNQCSVQIQSAQDTLSSLDGGLDHQESLETFLSKYCDEFMIQPFVYILGTTSVDETFIDLLAETVDTISNHHTIDYPEMLKVDAQELSEDMEPKDVVVDLLFEADFVELERQSLERYLIVPIYTDSNTFLVVLKTKRGTIEYVDGPHVTNLTYVFEEFFDYEPK